MSSDGLAVGASAPETSGTLVYPDGTTEESPLADWYADQPLLLVFYTNDFSPDCIGEWCSFRDYDWFTTGEAVNVVGASKSKAYTHRKFIDYLDLSFPLYADTDLTMAKAFDVDYRAFKIAPRARRSCFLIDTEGTIRYKWVGEHPVDPTRDTPPVPEVHEAIATELGLETPV